MMDSLLNTIYLAIVFLALFASAEWLYHRWKVEAELTRKYVHLSTGLLTLLFPALIGNHWLVLLLCSSFLLILLGSLKWNLLPSINAVDRVTRGSILYPIIVYGCYFVFQKYDQYLFYYIPILILAISDPIAALVGKKYPRGRYTFFNYTKTTSGSLGFCSSAFVISLAFLSGVRGLSMGLACGLALIVAFVSTLAEALSHKGYDNLSIPASTLLTLIFFKELNLFG